MVGENVKQWVREYVAGITRNNLFLRGHYQQVSRGASSSGRPIILDPDGKIDDSFFDIENLAVDTIVATRNSSVVYDPNTIAHNPIITVENPMPVTGASAGIGFRVDAADAALQRAFIGAVSIASSAGPDIVFKIRTGPTNYFEAMRVTSLGRVGIGTTVPGTLEPGSKLSVNGNDATAIYSTVINSGAGQAGFVLRRTGTIPSRWFLYTPASYDQMRIFHPSGGDLLALDGNGGIGLHSNDIEAHHPSYRGIHLGLTGYILVGMAGTGGVHLADNLYYDAAGFKGRQTGSGADLTMVSGDFYFQYAPTTIDVAATLTTRMYLQGATGFLGIGPAFTTPFNLLHARKAAVSGSDSNVDDLVVLENNGHAGINIISSAASVGNVVFSDDVRARGYISYNHANDGFTLATAGAARLGVDAAGAIQFFSGANVIAAIAGTLNTVPDPDILMLEMRAGHSSAAGTVRMVAHTTSGIEAAYISADARGGGIVLRTNAPATDILLQANGRVQISDGLWVSATGRPAVEMTQATLTDGFFRFNATEGATNPVSAAALGAFYRKVRVNVNGVNGWIAVYS